MWVPERVSERELADRRRVARADLVTNLADMALANRALGTSQRLIKALRWLLCGTTSGDKVTWLDVGCGGGDLAREVLSWSERVGVATTAVLADRSVGALAVAQETLEGRAVVPVRCDGRRLPLADGSVDVASCCHVAHHLSRNGAVALLAELRRVTRRGFVVIDLRRSWPAYWGARLSTALMGPGHQLTRHDGPLSVLKAWTASEAEGLARRAGLAGAVVGRGRWEWTMVWSPLASDLERH